MNFSYLKRSNFREKNFQNFQISFRKMFPGTAFAKISSRGKKSEIPDSCKNSFVNCDGVVLEIYLDHKFQ